MFTTCTAMTNKLSQICKFTLKKRKITQFGPFPREVTIVEVGARDGIQNEKNWIPTDIKIGLINRLADTGLRAIEATAFVSPKWVPQMKDNEEVMKGIERKPGVKYSVLVPNLKGLEKAIESGADEVEIFASASESFSRKNINCSIEQSLERFKPTIEAALQSNIPVRAAISCIFHDPYEGPVKPAQVVDVASRLYNMGCYQICLGDTTGVGTPGTTYKLINELIKVIPVDRIAVHFHDTYGQALSNILVALQFGVSVIDSSVAGFGGCPYAKSASGNVATEDVIYMLHGMGIETGVDFDKLVETGQWLSAKIGKTPVSNVNLAASALKLNHKLECQI